MTKKSTAPSEAAHAPAQRQNDIPRLQSDNAHGYGDTLFRSFFEHAAMGMTIGTSDGTWRKVNKRFCDITGYDSTELLNTHFKEITHPDDVKEDLRLLRELYLLKIPSFSREKRYAHASGVYLWVNITVSLASDDRGMPYHVAIVEDITRRKLAESALRQSERSLRSAHRIALLGTWEWNITSDEFVWSAEIQLILGRMPLTLDALLKQVHPDDVELVRNAIDSALEGKPLSLEFRVAGADSSERIVHMQGELAANVHRRPPRMVGTVQDITSTKLADQLTESRARLEGISSNIPGMVFQLQQIGDKIAFTYVSDGSNEVCGLTADRIVADPSAFLDLIHPDNREAFHDSKLRSRETLSLWNWEGRLEVADASTKWVNLRATPRHIGATEMIWDGVVFNISQSKQNEAEIEQSREMLRALTAHQMVVREEEGKRIAREIHDELGQRLTVLRMDVMMLPKLLAGPAAPVSEASVRMRDTIDGIIRIVRNISSYLRPAALDIDLLLAVEWLLDDFHASLGIPCNLNNKLDDSLDLDDERATGVFRILQESLTNIARHANAKHIEVTLELVDRHLHLHVKDDGTGFELKRRNAQKTFGLRGMRERAVALGGEISILSSPGSGTTVFASIPLSSE
ncbi:PAS domain S-box protein [Herbaspirillum sp. HC18]|nr:PAS domain S-box protein [Herbaspirillum sp. HC18]